MQTNLGKIEIDPLVILTIADYAAKEVDGVSTINRSVTDAVAHKIKNGIKAPSGFSVEKGETECIINVTVALQYGYKIPDTILKLQEKIKETVEAMTSYKVIEVNVTVGKIVVDKSDLETVTLDSPKQLR